MHSYFYLLHLLHSKLCIPIQPETLIGQISNRTTFLEHFFDSDTFVRQFKTGLKIGQTALGQICPIELEELSSRTVATFSPVGHFWEA